MVEAMNKVKTSSRKRAKDIRKAKRSIGLPTAKERPQADPAPPGHQWILKAPLMSNWRLKPTTKAVKNEIS
jgi:hypothetical protein